MDNFDAIRIELYTEIARRFTAYDFERKYVGGDEDEYTLGSSAANYDDFLDQQWEIVNRLDQNTLIFMDQIMRSIDNIDVVNMETMIKSRAQGFVFENGKLVMLGER